MRRMPGIMIGSGVITAQRSNIKPGRNPYPNNVSISCHLKEISHMVFQDDGVSKTYKNWKSKVYKTTVCTQGERREYNRLKDELKFGWGIVVKYIDGNALLQRIGLDEYYNINQHYIDSQCRCQGVSNVPTTRAHHYLNYHLGMANLEQIHAINYKILSTALSNIQNLQIEHNDGRVISAKRFFAQVKLSLELERDLAKEMLFSYNHYNTFPTVSRTVLKEKHIQKDHKCTIGSRGGLTHYNEDCGTYDHIGHRLEEIIQNGITANQLVDNFKKILRLSQSEVVVPQDNPLLVEKMQSYAELMFFTEVKRNAASLLTNAMFWDLVAEGVYQVTDIAQKMPMAMQCAVSASTTIDMQMEVNRYDYRTDNNPRNAEKLNTRDGKLILDWFLRHNLEDTVITINEFSTVADLNTFVPNFIEQNFLAANGNNLCTTNPIRFRIERTYTDNVGNILTDDTGQNLVFHANGTIIVLPPNTSANPTPNLQYDVRKLNVDEKAFYHIINNWFKIPLANLNNNIMRAMAEPQDPDEDTRDPGVSKVLVDDDIDMPLDVEQTIEECGRSVLHNLDALVPQYDIDCLGVAA